MMHLPQCSYDHRFTHISSWFQFGHELLACGGERNSVQVTRRTGEWGWGGGGGGEVELLISEKIEGVLHYSVPPKNTNAYFYNLPGIFRI